MTNTIGQFDYSITKLGKGSKTLPFNPWVHICLKSWGNTDVGSGAPLISAQLMSEEEIDTHIKDLKDDLDAVGTRAKKALKDAKAKTLEMVRERKTGEGNA